MGKQLSIWSKEEFDSFFPKKKTNKELFEEMLVRRASLSEEEIRKYDFVLEKESLVYLVKEYNKKANLNHFNLGIPQMLLTSISQYCRKKQNNLLLSDLVMMKKSIDQILDFAPYEVTSCELKKFRKANNLSFFGYSQYELMNKYFSSFE